MTTSWTELQAHANRLSSTHLRDLFQEDPARFDRFSARVDDLLIDFSKEKIDADVLDHLLAMAEQADVQSRRDAMVAGAAVNETEGRAVLHMALRGGAPVPDGADVAGVLDRFLAFAEQVRSSDFTDVINIGIGGSDLGPVMAVRALAPDADGPRLHFVSNVDGAHLTDVTRHLDPRTTLVVVASKTFTTLETMTNAASAKAWIADAVETPGDHFAAVSANVPACEAFGIAAERVFGFWDWVGGRYSLWSSIGLPIAIAIGAERFRAFLAGAAAMDDHFKSAPLAENLPVLLALIGVWRRNGLGLPSVALIPYDQRLERFPAYVQQLDMESNGKRVKLDGSAVDAATGPVIFGEPGTNSQHSFFQLMHQGADVIPTDFLLARRAREDLGDHHVQLIANCLAQAQALAFGKTETEVRRDMAASGAPAEDTDRLAPHRTFPGDRPSTTIMYDQLDAFALGRLIALFEHKVFVQGVMWGVNSYDQWGVELGKELAKRLIPAVHGEEVAGLDGSTAGLLAEVRLTSG